jgi:N-acetylneuraminic acid mutarotase
MQYIARSRYIETSCHIEAPKMLEINGYIHKQVRSTPRYRYQICGEKAKIEKLAEMKLSP